jgi:PKHD-type hydroxylase
MLAIYDVFTPDQIDQLQHKLDEIQFNDGKPTAAASVKHLKENTQADQDDIRTVELEAYVRDALLANPAFRLYARPFRWSRLLFSRYEPGQRYGQHVDSWILREHHTLAPLRSDLSFTVFLSGPDTYKGGELAIHRPEGIVKVKMPAGAAIVYPTNLVHEVLAVESGLRAVCVGWMQSEIRRTDERMLLYDLERVLCNMPAGDARLLLDQSIGALLRMWAEL